MAFNIVVEDGSIVPNANSYVSVVDFLSYAEMNGYDLETDNSVPVYLIKAMNYLESKNYKGLPVSSTQSLKWPREGAYIICEQPDVLYPSDSIPANLIKAQMQLALLVSDGIDLMPTISSESFVKMEKVGPLQTEYSDAAAENISMRPVFPLVDSLLQCMITNGFGLSAFRTVRASYG